MKEYALDLKDKKILLELDFDARQAYSEIGRKVGLSKQVVEYRINNLIAKGIVNGFYAVVQMPKLGYFYCRVSLTLQNISEQEMSGILEDLKQDSRVFWIFEMQGAFDLFFASWFRTLTEFKKFSDEIMSRYGRFIKKKTENIATDVIHYQHRYLLGTKETKEIHLAETTAREEIDALDKAILSALCENARVPLIEIARKAKESPKTIAYRIRRMEKSRIIEAYRANIDHSKLSYTYYKVFVNINNFTQQELRRLKEYIKGYPNTIYIVEGINLHANLDFELMIKSNQDLFDFIKQLRKTFPKIIEDYSTVIFMKVHKVKYLPF